MEDPIVNMMESQWKLRQQHDQKIFNVGKAIVEQMLASEERKKSKSRTVRIMVWDHSKRVNHLSK